jgi:hypothetical protein
MARRKSAIDRIDHHEKICRLMQKQTFERIDRMETRIARMEKWIVGGCCRYSFSCTFKSFRLIYSRAY